MGLGSRFRGLYNLRNIVSYGLRQYSAGDGALGIEFRGPRSVLRMQGVWSESRSDFGRCDVSYYVAATEIAAIMNVNHDAVASWRHSVVTIRANRI